MAVALAPTFSGRALAQQRDGAGTRWGPFRADRPELLERLAPAFVSCFKRRDSLIDPASPIFHGCLDWHSAVHAAYSHHVAYRRTGDKRYLKLAQDQIAPGGVSLVPAEAVYQRVKAQDLPLSERPYGLGWFLVFAREREQSTGKKDFRDMADYAAQELAAWFRTRLQRGDASQYILNTAHPNYSWSLINLDVWARYTKNKKLRNAVQKAAKPLLNPSLNRLCPVNQDRNKNAQGFQPACLMRVAAVAHIRGAASRQWVDARVPRGFSIPPVTKPANCHAGGLNFTRAFALYQIYSVTGEESLRRNYVKLIRYHVGRPDLYRGESYLGNPGYLCYSHWVAQMGVRAISLSYGG